MTGFGEIDPQWWAPAFGDDSEPYPAPEAVSHALSRLATTEGITDPHRDVLAALATCTSAMLSTENWLEPFAPAIMLHDRRTAVPADLEPAQVELLAQIAHLIPQPSLRARVADVSWFYGNRSDVTLLDLAIDAYAAAPLTPDVWFAAGRVAVERAFQLLRRRGSDGRARLNTLTTSLTEWVLGSGSGDGYMVVDCAKVLREQGRPDRQTATQVSEQLVRLASAPTLEPRAARLLELEAAEWFGSRDKAARLGCVERAGRTYIAEADARVAADPRAGALVESHFLEDAIKVLQGLPRSYRTENGVESLLSELRTRLTRSREHAIEAMTRIEADPTDLSEAVAHARERVSGLEDPEEALAKFATLLPPVDAARVRGSAAESVANSLRSLFSSSTFSADGRKVAARSGDADGQAAWDATVQHVSIHAHLAVVGLILPAQQVVTLEHRYDRELLTRICIESPVIPAGHERLWGAGLALGLGGDYGLAASVLVPQLEQLIRQLLKGNGVHTLHVDPETGVESEKSLNTLLELPEATSILGDGLVLEFQALLVHPGAANLRNDIAHGLFNDAAGWTHEAIFMWWSCLRLAVHPWWQMRRTP